MHFPKIIYVNMVLASFIFMMSYSGEVNAQGLGCTEFDDCCAGGATATCGDSDTNPDPPDTGGGNDDREPRPPNPQTCEQGTHVMTRLYIDRNNNGTIERSDRIRQADGTITYLGYPPDSFVQATAGGCVATNTIYPVGPRFEYFNGVTVTLAGNSCQLAGAGGGCTPTNFSTLAHHNSCINRLDRRMGNANPGYRQAGTYFGQPTELARVLAGGQYRIPRNLRIDVAGMSGYSIIRTEWCTNGVCSTTPRYTCGLNSIDILLASTAPEPMPYCRVSVQDGSQRFVNDATPSNPVTKNLSGGMRALFNVRLEGSSGHPTAASEQIDLWVTKRGTGSDVSLPASTKIPLIDPSIPEPRLPISFSVFTNGSWPAPYWIQ